MQISSPSASFTRPSDTTSYSAGDLAANSTTAGSVTPLSWTLGYSAINAPFSIKRATLTKTTTTVTNASFRLHLYTASPAVSNGDNGAYTSTKAANYLGYINIDATTTPGAKFSDGAAGVGAMTAGSEINAELPSGNTIYGLVEVLAAYGPGSAEVFTVTLDLIEHRPQ